MTAADLDALCRLVAEDRFTRWGYRETLGEEGRAEWVAEQAAQSNLRADVAVVYDAVKADLGALRDQLTRTKDREAQHARIVVAVERIAGDLDGAGAVDGSEVAAALRAAYRAGATP